MWSSTEGPAPLSIEGPHTLLRKQSEANPFKAQPPTTSVCRWLAEAFLGEGKVMIKEPKEITQKNEKEKNNLKVS